MQMIDEIWAWKEMVAILFSMLVLIFSIIIDFIIRYFIEQQVQPSFFNILAFDASPKWHWKSLKEQKA